MASILDKAITSCFAAIEPIPGQPIDSVRLCHFPIRSIEQYAGKIAVGYLQYAATPGWNRRAGFHYLEPYRLLSAGLDGFTEAMERDSRRYSFDPDWPDLGEPRNAPLDYRGGSLTSTHNPASALGSVMHCAETIAGKLVEKRAPDRSRAAGLAGRKRY